MFRCYDFGRVLKVPFLFSLGFDFDFSIKRVWSEVPRRDKRGDSPQSVHKRYKRTVLIPSKDGINIGQS